MGFLVVQGEGGLAVGAGLDQPVPVALGVQLADARDRDRAATVLKGVGRHGQPHVVGH